MKKIVLYFGFVLSLVGVAVSASAEVPAWYDAQKYIQQYLSEKNNGLSTPEAKTQAPQDNKTETQSGVNNQTSSMSLDNNAVKTVAVGNDLME